MFSSDVKDQWQEVPVEPPENPTCTAEIYRIARMGERHAKIRYIVKWTPRGVCDDQPPPEEVLFHSRLDAIAYINEVAPMAIEPPELIVEAWMYDPELYIHAGRKRYVWTPIERFELVRNVLVQREV